MKTRLVPSPTLIAALLIGAAAALPACTATRAPVVPPPPPAPATSEGRSPPEVEVPSPYPIEPAQDAGSRMQRKTEARLMHQEAAAATASARAMTPMSAQTFAAPPPAQADRERYAAISGNPVIVAAEAPVSTFSVDVDTGSYSNVRRMLNEGRLPPRDAVRVEELINYFDYAYAGPSARSTPFAVHTELGITPWNPDTELLAIGIQGWMPPAAQTRPSNLVFLVDVSGSMQDTDKLPLVKASLKLLAAQLSARDRISIVVYAGRTEVVLEPTPGDQTATIVAALDRLEAGGSTNGAGGIQLAYAMAEKGFLRDGNNRVLLATDGDFNVGIHDVDALKALVEQQRKGGVALSTLGFGTGNYNDALMEAIADVGNGHYRYIDSAREAQRVLVEERASALETIAADVKVQIEFNPAVVAEYRLIGYENRLLKREDFSNDTVDAGDIGAGHRVTALYEIARVGGRGSRIEPLRYGNGKADQPAAASSAELAHLRLRWKQPDDGMAARSRLIERALPAAPAKALADTSPAFRLAAAVAGYGQLLRGSPYMQSFALPDAAALAAAAGVDQASGRTAEFVELARLAAALAGEPSLATRTGPGDR